jgi:hypothetical protein
MLTCNLMGGLGNQIFQIFATISYSIKTKNPFKFLNVESLGTGQATIRSTYWNTFFYQLKKFLIEELPHINVIREKGFAYNELNINDLIGNECILYGYFQSYKYFEEHFSTICKLINLEVMKNNVLDKLNLSRLYLKNTVSIHFRVGDYKKFQDFHPILSYEYYEKSLEYIESQMPTQKFTILYFCEDEDHEEILLKVNKLIDKFPNYTFIRGDNSIQDWEQLLLMSCCEHNIIANSSFSWWAAYFNSNIHKIVCYPSKWFGVSANLDTKDLCPTEWVKIYN